VDLNQTLYQLSTRWTSSFHARIYKPGSLACTSQLLYQVLTTSIKVSIRHEVSQHLQCFPNLDSDGMAFWLCLTQIFPNTQIFTSSIKTQIQQLSLHFCGDLNDYIMQVEDLIYLLGPYLTDELLPALFCEFKMINCHYFHKALFDLEQTYYLGNQQDVSCLTLCAKVTEIKCIQEQAQQLDTPSPDDPTILALHATIAQQNSTLLAQQEVLEALTAHPSHHHHQND